VKPLREAENAPGGFSFISNKSRFEFQKKIDRPPFGFG
jgi:hypothetical protein